jgi:hypothetical protein
LDAITHSQFAISDFGSEMQESSNLEISHVLSQRV